MDSASELAFRWEQIRLDCLKRLEDNPGDAYTMACLNGHSWRVSREISPIGICPTCWNGENAILKATDIHPDVQAEWDKQFANYYRSRE